MFKISTKYQSNSDYKAILINKNSNLSKLGILLDLKSLNILRDKASKNKRGFTFISRVQNGNFGNIYFFNINECKNEFEYQNIGGKIVSEALNLKKDSIELITSFLPNQLKKKTIISNILIGFLSRNYFFNNYKSKKIFLILKKLI
jgi:leucyl aminopeptidase